MTLSPPAHLPLTLLLGICSGGGFESSLDLCLHQSKENLQC